MSLRNNTKTAQPTIDANDGHHLKDSNCVDGEAPTKEIHQAQEPLATLWKMVRFC